MSVRMWILCSKMRLYVQEGDGLPRPFSPLTASTWTVSDEIYANGGFMPKALR